MTGKTNKGAHIAPSDRLYHIFLIPECNMHDPFDKQIRQQITHKALIINTINKTKYTRCA